MNRIIEVKITNLRLVFTLHYIIDIHIWGLTFFIIFMKKDLRTF